MSPEFPRYEYQLSSEFLCRSDWAYQRVGGLGGTQVSAGQVVWVATEFRLDRPAPGILGILARLAWRLGARGPWVHARGWRRYEENRETFTTEEIAREQLAHWLTRRVENQRIRDRAAEYQSEGFNAVFSTEELRAVYTRAAAAEALDHAHAQELRRMRNHWDSTVITAPDCREYWDAEFKKTKKLAKVAAAKEKT